MLKMQPHVILQKCPYTLYKSQVIHTCIDFDKFYMFLVQNLESIMLVYFVYKFEQTNIKFLQICRKPTCYDFFV